MTDSCCPICRSPLADDDMAGFPCDPCTEAQPMDVMLSSWPQLEQCPVGQNAGSPHLYRPGTGVVVEWSVMGDPRTTVESCAYCMEGVAQ